MYQPRYNFETTRKEFNLPAERNHMISELVTAEIAMTLRTLQPDNFNALSLNQKGASFKHTFLNH